MKSLVALVLAISGPLAAQQDSAGINFYSLEREIAAGGEVAAQLAASLPVIHDARLDAWMDRLGSSLAPPADRRFVYSFTLFDGRTPPPGCIALTMPFDAMIAGAEPIAVAGGSIFVPAGLLASSPNEAAFAFQLAHAIAHIVLRQPTRMATRAEIVGKLPPPFMGDWQSNGALGLQALAQTLEVQADDLAVELASAAGYDPAAALPHLDPQRSARLRATIEKLPAREYHADTGQFATMKALAAQ